MDVSAFLSILLVLLFGVFLAPVMNWPDLHSGTADLPKVLNPIPMRGANREDAIVFVVQRDGNLWFRGQRVRRDDVLTRIREAINHGAERRVYIRADARAKYANVLELLRTIRSAGIENVAFLADKRKSS